MEEWKCGAPASPFDFSNHPISDLLRKDWSPENPGQKEYYVNNQNHHQNYINNMEEIRRQLR